MNEPLYQECEARHLKLGDIAIRLQDGVDRAPKTVLGIETTLLGNVRVQWSLNGFDTYVPGSPFFRQVPADDDPRVLRRAAEFLAAYYANTQANPDIAGELREAIELARIELESEAGNE